MNFKPQLRFPEFSGEWEEKKLGEVSFLNPKSDSLPDKFIYIDLDSVESGLLKKKKVIFKNDAPSRAQRVLENFDILYQTVRPYQKNNYFFSLKDSEKYVASTGYAQIRAKDDSKFLYYAMHTERFVNEVLANCTGTSYPAINSKDLGKIKLRITSVMEQEKIASFLSKVDSKIDLLEKKQELWETYKKGIMQQIFSQKLRFKDENGENYPDWEETKFSDILFEHKTKSTGNEEVFSVSVHKGLVNQVEHLGRTFAAQDTSKYNLVKPGDIVYTKSPTGDFPLGIIKQSKLDKNVIVSPLYGVFSPINTDLGLILDSYFESPINTKNYLHPIVQKGAKNTMNISNNTFLSRSLILSIHEKEQSQLANFLSTIAKKIEITHKESELVKKFKKGLLQQMFC
jgi:type I restriction enzyme S subunit